ncbi:MAG: septal ring lytic transglycosylase RlpA family protein [Armatimonadota bacterium]
MDISTTVAKAAVALVLLSRGGTLATWGDGGAKATALRDVGTKRTSASDKSLVPTGKVLKGIASWYGGRFDGRRTAYGERFSRHAMTLACRHLPYNTRVRITNLRNGKTAIGRVNDYGPRMKHRVADLSEGLAKVLGAKSSGLAPVKMEVLRAK